MRKWLLALLAFNAFSAVGGGIGVVGNAIGFPLTWLRYTPFHSYEIPGIILIVAVGGSASWALVALLCHVRSSRVLAGASGIIMIGWIISEVLLLHAFSFLHLLYFSTGVAVLVLALLRLPQGAVSRRMRGPCA